MATTGSRRKNKTVRFLSPPPPERCVTLFQRLQVVLIIKIVITLVAWALPLLFFPRSWLVLFLSPQLLPPPTPTSPAVPATTSPPWGRIITNDIHRDAVVTMMIHDEPSLLLIRLLGWAYLALCVGYYDAYRQAQRQREVPRGIMYMGIVSNGGAAIILTLQLFLAASNSTIALSSSTCNESDGINYDQEPDPQQVWHFLLLGGSAIVLYAIARSLLWLLNQFHAEEALAEQGNRGH